MLELNKDWYEKSIDKSEAFEVGAGLSQLNRLIAIGDIHGQSQMLRVLLDSINPVSTDTFVFLGDLINRGKDSKGVIDQVLDLKSKCKVYSICGNHEEMLLGAIQGGKSDHDFFVKLGGFATLQSYDVPHVRNMPREHLLFVSDCLDYYENDKYIFVHAGCDPHILLKENTSKTLRWNHFKADQILPHISGKTVVCGHTVQKNIFDIGHFLCIDTGCGVWVGGKLTGIDLISGRIWQVNGRSKKATSKER